MKYLLKKILRCYLKYITKMILVIHRPMIIAIAGSTNKTFIKEEVSRGLEEQGRGARSNPRSFNTDIGLPLAILDLPSGYNGYKEWLPAIFRAPLAVFQSDFPRILVLELGVSDPGDMKYLLSIIKPDIAVVADLTQRYLESFDDMDNLAGEYEYLVNKIKSTGLIALNFDNLRIKNMAKSAKGKVVSFGLNKGAGWQAAEVKNKDGRKRLVRIKYPHSGAESEFEIERPGRHHIYSFLVGLIVNHYIKDINIRRSSASGTRS